MIIVPDASIILKWVLEKEDEPDYRQAFQLQESLVAEQIEMRLPTLWRYEVGKGFSETGRIACPDLTGSYLSYDGRHLYLSQWYRHRILQLNGSGKITREIEIGAEISGHVFIDGVIYVLRGTEQNQGDWRLARFDLAETIPQVRELARVPFQCRSLAFDGSNLWTNHREADQIVCFGRPA